VYSTCTLAPEEDEGVIDTLLRAYPGIVQVDMVEHVPVARTAPGLAADGARHFLPGVRHAVRLWPHQFRTSGFFAARLRKTGPINASSDPLPSHAWALDPLTAREHAALITDWRDGYGFDLEVVLDAHGLSLWQRDKALFAVPDILRDRFGHVPHLAAGLLIGHWTGERAVPSHELVTRFEAQFTGTRLTLPGEHMDAWIEGRDLRSVEVPSVSPGVVVLVQDEVGRFLGLGAAQRDRVRNLRPRRLTYQG